MGRDWHPQVYFAQHPEDKYIKIGYTINLQWRLWQLQSDYKVKLELLGVMEGDKDVERKLHHMFKPEWRFGEWHRPSERLLAYIAENAHYVDITPTPKPLRKNTRGHEARYRVGVEVRRVYSDGIERHSHYDNYVRQSLIQRYGSARQVNRSQISRESGIPQTAVSIWVRGHQEFAYQSTIQRWADYFGCTVEDIVSFAEKEIA